MKLEVKYYLGYYGHIVGWTMVFSPILWDMLMLGLRKYEEIKVCWLGCLIILLGAGLIHLSKWCKENI